MKMPLLEFKNVSKYYQMGDTTVRAVDNISFKIYEGEFVAIVGQSGSGKSTCMNILGCLDVPTSGTYIINGTDVGNLNSNELSEIRNKMIGFIFQQYYLLPKLDAIGNVELPMIYASVKSEDRKKRASSVLERVGLSEKTKNYPTQLSGGEQQRVSIARALTNLPKLILADEPTGALDSKTGLDVMNLLKELNEDGTTVVLITHNNDLAKMTQRILRIADGKIISDETNIKSNTEEAEDANV